MENIFDAGKIVRDLVGTNAIKSLGLESLTEKEKISIQKKLIEIVTSKALTSMIENMSKEDLEQYKKLEEQDEEKAWQFVLSKFPNLKEIVTSEYVMTISEMQKENELMKKIIK